ncbi:MAG: hypothetical protein Q9191_004821 [Dirinaria sp. TL-2023a]
MGKAKKAKPNRALSKPYNKESLSKLKSRRPLPRKPGTTPDQAPTIPFGPADRILLVGEGDFSFARSLLNTHGCSSLVATCYDNHSVLLEKYPQARTYVDELEAEVDVQVVYNVDATKLSKAPRCIRDGTFDRIVFNFPHVGGLTKDVNRQVRHNQELLVGFFNSALPLLSPTGLVVLTIFEGEPYTLWNVRDLGRHVGLKVGRSFKFEATAYPGYKHARTLGNIKDGGGWKGEDRGSRTYLFESDDRETQQPSPEKVRRYDTDDSDD